MQKTKIEYVSSTWNPVTGCYHDCPYCYARGTSKRFTGCNTSPDGTTDLKIVELEERLEVTNKDGVTRNASYPYGFKPTFHKYRLDDLQKKGFGETIFICSMGELLGDWVPDEWIEQVFDACKAADNHRYLFLTKNPGRYIALETQGKLPHLDNFWYGTSVPTEDTSAFWSDDVNTFVSVEPIQGPFCGDDEARQFVELTNWIILGAETGNQKDKVVPEKAWIEDLVEEAWITRTPVFMKDSMIPIWGEDLLRQVPWA